MTTAVTLSGLECHPTDVPAGIVSSGSDQTRSRNRGHPIYGDFLYRMKRMSSRVSAHASAGSTVHPAKIAAACSQITIPTRRGAESPGANSFGLPSTMLGEGLSSAVCTLLQGIVGVNCFLSPLAYNSGRKWKC